MAEEQHNTSSHEYQTAPVVDHGRQEDAVESKDRGLFDFLGKKEEEKPQEEVIGTKFEEKVSVSAVPEPKLEKEEYKEEKKGDVSEKLHRSNSSSSSVSIHLYFCLISNNRCMNQLKSVLIINNFVLVLI